MWAPTSVFGAPLTPRHDAEVLDILTQWGWRRLDKEPVEARRLEDSIERDAMLVRAGRRWSGSPLTPPQTGRFVPGDIAAIRWAVAIGDIAGRAAARLERLDAGDPIDETGHQLDAIARWWLYQATPYFVDVTTLVGLVDCELPSAVDMDELVMPASSVAVFFGGDVDVPAGLVDDDASFDELAERFSAEQRQHPEWVSSDGIRSGTLSPAVRAVARGHRVQVCGVVLHADDDGHLDDLVLWLTVAPGERRPRGALYGWLSRSTLRYVAVNLAAAVAWGQWTAPSLDGTETTLSPPTLTRDLVRSSRFRRREPYGGAVGVRVLDARRTISRASADGGTHASPITHRRRRHWRRQRVGPRDEWRYERRLIAPIIVNPGGQLDQRLTVYRLPPPPTG